MLAREVIGGASDQRPAEPVPLVTPDPSVTAGDLAVPVNSRISTKVVSSDAAPLADIKGEVRTVAIFAVVVIASGALSHTFWKLRQLRDHEAADLSHIRSPEARAADEERIAWFKAGDHERVLDTMPEFMRHRPESMFAHYLMMAGAVGEGACTATGRQYGDYENSVGTGQVHLWFDRPDGGFPPPAATPADPDFVRQSGGPDLPAAGCRRTSPRCSSCG